MADNLALKNDAATTIGTVATDDVGGVHYPIGKLAHGALDTATLVSTASGLPVAQQGDWSVACTNAGTFAVQAAQSGTWTVQPGNTANSTAWLVSERPAVSGGLSAHKTISAASTNATSVKASAGQVYDLYATNTSGAVRYLKLYDKSSAPAVGADAPVLCFAIPGATTGAGFSKHVPTGFQFASGIAFALTTGAADNDTGAVGAGEVVVNLGYK